MDPFLTYPPAQRWYRKIRRKFHYSLIADREARDLLYSYRLPFPPDSLLKDITNKMDSRIPLFFGAGSNLDSHLQYLKPILSTKLDLFYLIAADGAARGLAQYHFVPQLIFSDLDGLSPEDLSEFLLLSSILIAHAHGDNINRMKTNHDLLCSDSAIIGTTQVEARYPILNPGGFTDGDRAVYFCHHLSPCFIPFLLFGFDFAKSIGRFSKPSYTENLPMTRIKQQKLHFCQALLTDLHQTTHRQILIYGQELEIDEQIEKILSHGLPTSPQSI